MSITQEEMELGEEEQKERIEEAEQIEEAGQADEAEQQVPPDTLVSIYENVPFTYIKSLPNKFTFQRDKVRIWLESRLEGVVLNLFSGPTRLNCTEVRNDSNNEMDADFHMDAKDFLNYWYVTKGAKFDTILLDPPYSLRKSMEKYKGHKVSNFFIIKELSKRILKQRGIVISFGYHSSCMGKRRGFEQEEILLIGHGGSSHDTIAVIERWVRDPKTKRSFT